MLDVDDFVIDRVHHQEWTGIRGQLALVIEMLGDETHVLVLSDSQILRRGPDDQPFVYIGDAALEDQPGDVGMAAVANSIA